MPSSSTWNSHPPAIKVFDFFLIINFLSPDRLCDFYFYVELASSGYLNFGVYLIIYLLTHPTVCVSSLGGTIAPITPSWIRHLYACRYPYTLIRFPLATVIVRYFFQYHCFGKISIHMPTKTGLVIICVTQERILFVKLENGVFFLEIT